jgi:hypothetical protein
LGVGQAFLDVWQAGGRGVLIFMIKEKIKE